MTLSVLPLGPLGSLSLLPSGPQVFSAAVCAGLFHDGSESPFLSIIESFSGHPCPEPSICWVKALLSSRASVLQVPGHRVMCEVFPAIILGCKTFRRPPRKKWWPQQGTQTPGKGCCQVAAGVSGLCKQLSFCAQEQLVVASPTSSLLHKCPRARAPAFLMLRTLIQSLMVR